MGENKKLVQKPAPKKQQHQTPFVSDGSPYASATQSQAM